MGVRDRAGPAADARARPQQDARRAALQRVPRVLPGQRGRVLRLLLRLLPARGLRPAPGPLHREGLLDQRRDRPAAPRRHGAAVRPRGRDHRRLGVVRSTASARPQLYKREDAAPRRWGSGSTATRRCGSSSSMQYTRNDANLARGTFRVRGEVLEVHPGLRRERLPRRSSSATRSSGSSTSTRSRGEVYRRPRPRRRLAGDALRHGGGHRRALGRGDQARAGRALQGARAARASCSSRTACASAPSTTWRC